MPDDSPQRSVAAFVYRRPPFQVLLLKRTPERGGFWQPVTGSVERDDDAMVPFVDFTSVPGAPACADRVALMASAVREVAEETCIEQVLRLVDLGLETRFTGFDGRTYHERAFAVEVAGDAACKISDEHTDARWCMAGEAAELLKYEENREALCRLVAHVER